MSESLHTKYRPTTFDEVFGNEPIVRALQSAVRNRSSQTFLLSGPAGTGKTTLARIAAKEFGASLYEVAAAVTTGVESMRDIIKVTQQRPLDADSRAVILDEAQRLSGNAWDAILKATEEPPPSVFWFLCTTNPSKVPKTIISRCLHLQLKEIPDAELGRLLDGICEAEGIDLPSEVKPIVIKEAYGSPRQMLTNLAACREATTRAEAAQLLKAAIDSDVTIELCRLLASGGSWMKAVGIIKKMDDVNPESVRIVVCNYMASALKNSKSDKDAVHFLSILEHFATPYNASENLAPLLLSIGRVLFGG